MINVVFNIVVVFIFCYIIVFSWFMYKTYEKQIRNKQKQIKEKVKQIEEIERATNELEEIAKVIKSQTILAKKIGELAYDSHTTRQDLEELLPICRWQDEIYDNMLTLEEAKGKQDLHDCIKLETLVEVVLQKRFG